MLQNLKTGPERDQDGFSPLLLKGSGSAMAIPTAKPSAAISQILLPIAAIRQIGTGSIGKSNKYNADSLIPIPPGKMIRIKPKKNAIATAEIIGM